MRLNYSNFKRSAQCCQFKIAYVIYRKKKPPLGGFKVLKKIIVAVHLLHKHQHQQRYVLLENGLLLSQS